MKTKTPLRFFVFCLIVLAAVGVWIITPSLLDTSKRTAKRSEKSYSEPWCEAQKGEINAVLSDGTRPDCLLADTVVEFDFGEKNKPYECSGQARHYANISGKKPLCILIQRSDISDNAFALAVNKVTAPIKCMNANNKIFPCP